MKDNSNTIEVQVKPFDLRMKEESGILKVEMKFVNIQRNTKSEGNFLGHI